MLLNQQDQPLNSPLSKKNSSPSKLKLLNKQQPLPHNHLLKKLNHKNLSKRQSLKARQLLQAKESRPENRYPD